MEGVRLFMTGRLARAAMAYVAGSFHLLVHGPEQFDRQCNRQAELICGLCTTHPATYSETPRLQSFSLLLQT